MIYVEASRAGFSEPAVNTIEGIEDITLENPQHIRVQGEYPFQGRMSSGLFDAQYSRSTNTRHSHVHKVPKHNIESDHTPHSVEGHVIFGENEIEKVHTKKRARTFRLAALGTLTLAGVELGLEAVKYRMGLQSHNLSFRDALHNIPDTAYYGTIYTAAALKASDSQSDDTMLRHRASKFIEQKISPGALIFGGLLNTMHATYMHFKNTAYPILGSITNSDISPIAIIHKLNMLRPADLLHAPLIVAAGNLAIAGIVYKGTKDSRNPTDIGGQKHALNDGIATSLQAAASAFSQTIDSGIGVVFGLNDTAIGLKVRSKLQEQRRSAQFPEADVAALTHHHDCHDDGHDHEHELDHDHDLADVLAPSQAHTLHTHEDHGPSCVHEHHELVSRTIPGRLLERTVHAVAPKNDQGRRRLSVPLAVSSIILLTAAGYRHQIDTEATEHTRRVSAVQIPEAQKLYSDPHPHVELVLSQNSDNASGTIWDLSKKQLENAINQPPTNAQIMSLTESVLIRNQLTWEDARSLPPGTPIRFPSADEVRTIVN